MPLPAIKPDPANESSLIAGSVLPIQTAEELLATLPGVLSARIVVSTNGAVDAIHMLTTTAVTPKQTVRNVESALIAQLGMHVSHKKISVATSVASDARRTPSAASIAVEVPAVAVHAAAAATGPAPVLNLTPPVIRRRIYFEDIDVRRSRSKGITCRVTLRNDEKSFVGESEGMESPRARLELSARATLSAITQAVGDEWVAALEGCQVVDAFDRQFVLVGIVTRLGRDSILMTGSAEVRESPETASVLAVLDATNRWLDR